jgi:hypothetical protein
MNGYEAMRMVKKRLFRIPVDAEAWDAEWFRSFCLAEGNA